jgi:hypothetical protein
MYYCQVGAAGHPPSRAVPGWDSGSDSSSRRARVWHWAHLAKRPDSVKAAASHRATPFHLETLAPELTAAAANPSTAAAIVNRPSATFSVTEKVAEGSPQCEGPVCAACCCP